MAVEQITEHVEQCQSRVLTQFSRPNMAGLITALGNQVQALEDAIFTLLGAFDVASATGAQLDATAAIVGVNRYGLSDAQLRTLLYGLITLHNGSATAETIVSVAKALFQTDQVFFADGQSGKHQAQVGRGQVMLAIGSSSLPDDALALAKSLIGQALGAGIQLSVLASFTSSQAFACQGPQAWVRGYGSVASPKSGGQLAGLLT